MQTLQLTRLIILLLLLLSAGDVIAARKCGDLSDDGVRLVMEFEGFREHAYMDSDNEYAIGYGTKGPSIRHNTIWPEWYAQNVLIIDLLMFREQICEQLTTSLNEYQISALSSLAYNIGFGRLKRSGILELVNARRFREATQQMLRFTRANGVKLKGLERRRQAEVKLFYKKVTK